MVCIVMSDKVQLTALIAAGPCKYLTDEKLNFALPLHTHKQSNVLANNLSWTNTAVGSHIKQFKMKNEQVPGGNSDGGYNKLIGQGDVSADEQALYSIEEKQQGTDHTLKIQKTHTYPHLQCQRIQKY